MNPLEPQPVYVLHSRPWKESSLMVDILSLEYGRLRLIARGAKRKNGHAHLLQAFQPLLLTWSGRSDLKTLISCEAGQRLPLLSGNKMMSGLYVNELILKLCPLHQKVEEVFFSYAKLLNDMHIDLSQTLRVFELNFLSTLGLLPDLDTDCHGDELQAGHFYHVHPVDGVYPSSHSQDRVYSAELLLACHQREHLDPVLRIDAIRLTRMFVDYYLDGREMQTRKMAHSLKKFS